MNENRSRKEIKHSCKFFVVLVSRDLSCTYKQNLLDIWSFLGGGTEGGASKNPFKKFNKKFRSSGCNRFGVVISNFVCTLELLCNHFFHDFF